MAFSVISDPISRWTASSTVSNATCWPQEALNSTESFKPISKWRLLRSVFNCTRIWRDVGRQAQNLRVHFTLDLQFRSIEVNQDLATSKPCAIDPTLPTKVSSAIPCAPRDSLEDTKQSDKPHHGCKNFGNSQNSIFFGQVYKPCMFPLVIFAQPNCAEQSVLVVVAFAVVFLSLECNQYPTDHVDWGDWKKNYLFGSLLEFKNTCVSIVTLFQAASILLFQAAYFWLKFREALSVRSGRKRKLSDLEGVPCDEDVQKSMRGVYARPIKHKDGNVVGHKYEPRFKPPRERNERDGVLSFQNLSLGSYNDPRDAEIVRQIAAFYYDMDRDSVSLGEGHSFRIPAMSQHGLSGLEKAKWVSEKAKEVFELYCKPNTTFTTKWPQSDGLPSSTEIRSVSLVPCSTISHSGDDANNSAEPLSDNSLLELSLAEENLACVPAPRSYVQLGTELFDLQAPDEKRNISVLAIQHTGVFADLGNMVVEKDLNVELGETTQDADPSSTSLNFSQTLSQPTAGWKDAAEQLITMQDIGEFLLEGLEDVVLGNTVEHHQSEGSIDLAYCELQPLFFANQAPDRSRLCNTTLHGQSLSQFESAGQCLSNGIQLQSLEGGAATSCKWGLDALTSNGAPVHNYHYSEFPMNPMLSPQQGSNAIAPPAPARVTPSLLTNFCSENCTADLLVKVVCRQQQQIKELKRENERLKGASELKCSCQ